MLPQEILDALRQATNENINFENSGVGGIRGSI